MHASHWHLIIEREFAKIHNENFTIDHSTVRHVLLCWLHTQCFSDDLYIQIKHFQNKVLQYPKTSLLFCFLLPIKLPLQHLSKNGVVYCWAESTSFSCFQFQKKVKNCSLKKLLVFYENLVFNLCTTLHKQNSSLYIFKLNIANRKFLSLCSNLFEISS